MKNLKSGSSRVKGFTLIELVVVIAIIGILAGTSSVIISGFRRDARIETNDKKAQLMYTAMQDILVDCEIKQDISMFSSNQYNKAFVLKLDISPNNSGNVVVKEPITGTVYNEHGSSHGVNSDSNTQFKAIKPALEKRADIASLEGTYLIYIDLENYLVDSVIVRELQGGMAEEIDFTKDDVKTALGNCTKNTSKPNYSYRAFKNYVSHRNDAKKGAADYGGYPYLSDIGETV